MGQYTVDQNTVALLHFEDGFKDECGNIWNATGTPKLNTTEKYFGNSSLCIPGNSSFLKTVNDKFKFGAGDFTVDFWLKQNGKNYSRFISSVITPIVPTGSSGVAICLDQSWIGTNTSYDMFSGVLPVNTWTHVAIVKKATKFYYFIDGVLKQSGTISKAPAYDSDSFAIGAAYGDGYSPSDQPFYMDELRISNIARWTEPFTPGGEPGTVTPAPTNLTATGGDKKVTLSWNAVAGATGYNVKRSTTAGGPYTTIASNVAGTSYEDTNVVNGTTYYYVVTAMGPNGESANSNEASATPQASQGRALLRVTMTDSSEREYNLSASEIDAFISWYRAVSGDKTCYVFNKNVGSHSSKEYLAYDKIISFEVTSLPVA